MHKVWFALAFAAAATIANPARAQDYQRNFVECAKELGLARIMHHGSRFRTCFAGARASAPTS